MVRLWVFLAWAGALTLLLAARGSVESLANLLESGGAKRGHGEPAQLGLWRHEPAGSLRSGQARSGSTKQDPVRG